MQKLNKFGIDTTMSELCKILFNPKKIESANAYRLY